MSTQQNFNVGDRVSFTVAAGTKTFYGTVVRVSHGGTVICPDEAKFAHNTKFNNIQKVSK